MIAILIGLGVLFAVSARNSTATAESRAPVAAGAGSAEGVEQ